LINCIPQVRGLYTCILSPYCVSSLFTALSISSLVCGPCLTRYKVRNSAQIKKNPVRISQETHYVSATKPNRLMLFRKQLVVYCENHTEHTDTLCGQNAVYIRTHQSVPHGKHITSPLQRPTYECCLGKQSLFIVRTVRNT
jgi:hypothetical protein